MKIIINPSTKIEETTNKISDLIQKNLCTSNDEMVYQKTKKNNYETLEYFMTTIRKNGKEAVLIVNRFYNSVFHDIKPEGMMGGYIVLTEDSNNPENIQKYEFKEMDEMYSLIDEKLQQF